MQQTENEAYLGLQYEFIFSMKNKEPQSWVTPGNSLSHEEFLEGIKEAESAPFNSVQVSMENFDLWLKSREKK